MSFVSQDITIRYRLFEQPDFNSPTHTERNFRFRIIFQQRASHAQFDGRRPVDSGNHGEHGEFTYVHNWDVLDTFSHRQSLAISNNYHVSALQRQQ